MVESYSKIRQLLAESKFVEAQKFVEAEFLQLEGSESTELMELYFESLKSQRKEIPFELHISLVEKLLPISVESAQKWLSLLQKDKIKDEQRILLIEIRLAEIKGKTEDLYNLILRFQILRFEFHAPVIPEFIKSIIQKYFQQDFQIQLQKTALDLMRNDLVACEKTIIELILSCFERSSPKGTKEKLNSLYEVLSASSQIYHLELYKNFCFLMTAKSLDEKELKKVIELIIYVEDFRMQALILNLMVREGWNDIAKDYAIEIRQNPDYNYVYFDKFFPNIKPLFFQKKAISAEVPASSPSNMDLKVDKFLYQPISEEMLIDVSNEELLLINVLKHQGFSTNDLLELAVSFLQSDYYHAAFKAGQMAYDSTSDEELRLKASFLRVTCLLKNGDYRAALDISLDALSYSKTQNDILSFLYSQAEAHLRLKEFESAKKILKEIVKIDDNYRLTKERLEKLNAI